MIEDSLLDMLTLQLHIFIKETERFIGSLDKLGLHDTPINCRRYCMRTYFLPDPPEGGV